MRTLMDLIELLDREATVHRFAGLMVVLPHETIVIRDTQPDRLQCLRDLFEAGASPVGMIY
jgi:hypothetical protein